MELHQKSKKGVLLLAGVFFLLFSATPLLHNHAPTPYEPATCPAHILHITMQSSGVGLAAAFVVLLTVSRIPSPLQITQFHASNIEHHFSSRAPPSIG